MDTRTRERFDRQVDWVLARMPPRVHELLESVPLHVEDHPSAQMMAELGVCYREQLCGLYTGVPLGEKLSRSVSLPDVITIYREGILAAASDRRGRVPLDRLRKEIRTTILHELGHHHGLDEDELRELGYG